MDARAGGELRIRCRGFRLPWCRVPAFELWRGEAIHIVTLPWPSTERFLDLSRILSGAEAHPDVELFGTGTSVDELRATAFAYTPLWVRVRRRLPHWLYQSASISLAVLRIPGDGWFTLTRWLQRHGEVSAAEARRWVESLRLDPNGKHWRYPPGDRTKLAMMASLLTRQVAVVSTCGTERWLCELSGRLVAAPATDRAAIVIRYENPYAAKGPVPEIDGVRQVRAEWSV